MGLTVWEKLLQIPGIDNARILHWPVLLPSVFYASLSIYIFGSCAYFSRELYVGAHTIQRPSPCVWVDSTPGHTSVQ